MSRASSSRSLVRRPHWIALLFVTLALSAPARVASAHVHEQPPQARNGTIQQPTMRANRRGPVEHPEDAAVRVPLDAYLRGVASGDEADLRRAFLREARLWWSRDGQVAERTADEYIESVAGREEGEDAPHRRIVTVDISGETATATIEVAYATARFIDYVTLLKVGDEWRIATKAFMPDGRLTIS